MKGWWKSVYRFNIKIVGGTNNNKKKMYNWCTKTRKTGAADRDKSAFGITDWYEAGNDLSFWSAIIWSFYIG